MFKYYMFKYTYINIYIFLSDRLHVCKFGEN